MKFVHFYSPKGRKNKALRRGLSDYKASKKVTTASERLISNSPNVFSTSYSLLAIKGNNLKQSIASSVTFNTRGILFIPSTSSDTVSITASADFSTVPYTASFSVGAIK
ncbi:hypothetical protein FE819_01110 [Shigella sonnei]|nr:hypothetical protein [Shigella sonnei]